MSLQAINYVLAQETSSAVSRCLLIAIAHHVSNETGRCFAGQKLLGDEAGIAERTVREHLARLEADGYIKRSARYRSNEGRSSDEIELVGFLTWYAESATLARSGKKPPAIPAPSAGIENGPNSLPADCAGSGREHGSLPADGAGGTGICVPGYVNRSVNILPPYPPASGGDSAIDWLDQVNDTDRAAVERLAGLGEHETALRGVVCPILARCRLSAADKPAELAAIVTEANGLDVEQMRGVVRMVLDAATAAGRERVKADRIREAIRAARRSGAMVVISRGTPEWDAWVAHDRAAGKRYAWWERESRWQVPTALPPKQARAVA